MWAKFSQALGLGSGAHAHGHTAHGHRGGLFEGGSRSGLLDKHERSLDEMHDFERSLRGFEKDVKAYRASTEGFFGNLHTFLVDAPLPRLYEHITPAAATSAPASPMPGASSSGGLGGSSAPTSPGRSHPPPPELAVVEPPPPTLHARLYGTDCASELLAALRPGAGERFEALLLASSVWLGTYEDAKLRLAATQKLESKAFGKTKLGRTLKDKDREREREKDKDRERAAAETEVATGTPTGAATPSVAATPSAEAAGVGHSDSDADAAAAASEFRRAELLLAEEVGWLVRGAANLRAWATGVLAAATEGVRAAPGAVAPGGGNSPETGGGGVGPLGVLEPLPARIAAAPMSRRGRDKAKHAAAASSGHEAAAGVESTIATTGPTAASTGATGTADTATSADKAQPLAGAEAGGKAPGATTAAEGHGHGGGITGALTGAAAAVGSKLGLGHEHTHGHGHGHGHTAEGAEGGKHGAAATAEHGQGGAAAEGARVVEPQGATAAEEVEPVEDTGLPRRSSAGGTPRGTAGAETGTAAGAETTATPLAEGASNPAV